MITTIEVKKNNNENNQSLLRRFSRRVQESGMLPKVKQNRYAQRQKSKLVVKAGTLKKLARRKEVEKLKRLGKMTDIKR
jgi:hypothetical protein